jgi:hypothetical protein
MTKKSFLQVGVLVVVAASIRMMASCASESEACQAGFVMKDGTCVEQCASGTTFDAATGQCLPACGEDSVWNGTECQKIPTCDDGTTFNPETLQCEPDIFGCAPGTHKQEGVCVLDLSCGEGTHQEDSQCVKNRLGPPDVPEGPENNDSNYEGGVATEFVLPAEGQQITLGGTIQEAVDQNGDNEEDPDWDGFETTAAAGTYLRITATSEGACLPVLEIIGLDGNNRINFLRYGVNPNGLDMSREFYLPYSEKYVFFVTDYNNLVPSLFGEIIFPVGGSKFTYQVTVERLSTPIPVEFPVPGNLAGDFGTGSLKFYSLSGLTENERFYVLSTARSASGVRNHVFPALMIIDANGQLLREVVQPRMGSDTELPFRAPADGNYLVVQDFLLVSGNHRGYNTAVEKIEPLDISHQTEVQGSVAAGRLGWYSWDLEIGDFMVAGIYPSTNDADIAVYLYDTDMNWIAYSNHGSAGQFEDTFTYATLPTKAVLKVQEIKGNAAQYEIQAAQIATPKLESGVHASNLQVTQMPLNTFITMGVDHFVGKSGDMAIFTDFATHGGVTWNNKWEAVYPTDFSEIYGPALDVTNGYSPVVPNLTYQKRDDHFLHIAYGYSGDDIVGGTYETTLTFQPTTNFGVTTCGQLHSAPDQTLFAASGVAFYGVTLGINRAVRIEVTPTQNATLRPKIHAMNFGRIPMSAWDPMPDAPQLGAVDIRTATQAGESLAMDYFSPYDGLSFFMVSNADGPSTDHFDVSIQAYNDTPNDICENAEELVFNNGEANVTGTLVGNGDEVMYPGCTRQSKGIDVFYKLNLQAGDALTITLSPTHFDGVLYLFRDCQNVSLSCVYGVDEEDYGVPETLTGFVTPAGEGGVYYIAVDSYWIATGGPFTLNAVISHP